MSEVHNWLEFAKNDLRAAELLLEDKIYNLVCFHAQQCVEKCLKAWLLSKDLSVPRTHRMADLLPLLPDEIAEKLDNRLILFDQFYIPTRYPDAFPGILPEGLPDEEDAKEALELAHETMKVIRVKIHQDKDAK